MNSENIILRETDNLPLINKNDYLDNADFDNNFINIYNDFLSLCSTDYVDTFDNSKTYTIGEYVVYNGKMWTSIYDGFVNITPGTNEIYWQDTFPTFLAHVKNGDTKLGEGTDNEVTAEEIRAFIDAGLTSTTNLSLSTKTTTSFKIESSTGTDVIVPQATTKEAGLLSAFDKAKLNNLTGVNSGDQTLEGLNGENVDNKAVDFTTINDTLYPTTQAVDTYITEQVPGLVETFVDASFEKIDNKATDFTTVNDTLYPTVKAVDDHINSKLTGLWDDRGGYDASSNLFPSSGGSGGSGAILKGDIWTISVQGTLGGTLMHVGDTVRALTDAPGQTTSNWALLENAIGYVPENVNNKVTTFIGNTSSDTKYPSVKAIVDNFDSTNIKSILGITTLSGNNTGDQDLSNLLEKNTSITGATKTKITYDSKGLVTSGADATTSDIADSTNKRYVTDAQLTVLGNTSGTNTGDQIISDATLTTSDITTNNVSITKHGFVPKAPNNTTTFLRGDGTWATPSAGGLTFFTEAQSTSSPNATVNVDSLTAVASTTNADFVVRPKGTGAILGRIPDNTGTGGNKRGINAVDLQTFIDQPDQVASGNYSVVVGGQGNKASAINSSVLGGYYNNATGQYSTVIGGFGNSSIGTFSVTGGRDNVARGQDVMLGEGCSTVSSVNYNTASGYYNVITNGYHSTAFGGYNSLNGQYHFSAGEFNALTSLYGSIGLGYNAQDNGYSRFIYGSKGYVKGDTQSSKILLNRRTTDATPVPLIIQVSYGSGAATTNQITLNDNNSIRFKGSIIARQSGSTNTSAWDIDGIIQRGTSAATTTLLISNVNVVQNTPSWGTPTLAANTTLGCLTITVTGAATTNIQWSCAIDTTEVIYA
jgi:hypothetical protein